jgi:GNAT superfamily N-acetyltransferase
MVELVPLNESHSTQLDQLCAACADYYQEVTGLPPGPAEAQSLFLAVPPHGDYERKRLWGVFESDRLIGVVDGAFGHPEDGHFWIGLVMLEPAARGRGLGSAILNDIADQAMGGGATTLSLAVKSDYAAARRFWKGHGFRTIGERLLNMPGAGATRFELMSREVMR